MVTGSSSVRVPRPEERAGLEWPRRSGGCLLTSKEPQKAPASSWCLTVLLMSGFCSAVGSEPSLGSEHRVTSLEKTDGDRKEDGRQRKAELGVLLSWVLQLGVWFVLTSLRMPGTHGSVLLRD